MLQRPFWRKLKKKPFSYRMLRLDWNYDSVPHHPSPFIKQFGLLQKLHVKNYENYSSIMLESCLWNLRLFIIFLLKCPFQQHDGVPPMYSRNTEGTTSVSIHKNFDLIKRSLAIACYFFKGLAMSLLDGLMKNMYFTKIHTYWTNNSIDITFH